MKYSQYIIINSSPHRLFAAYNLIVSSNYLILINNNNIKILLYNFGDRCAMFDKKHTRWLL